MPALAPRATIGLAPAETTDAPPANDFPADANIYGDHNGLTNAQIGAMVGAIIGFTIIVLTFIFCCLKQRAHRRRLMHQHRRSKRYTNSSGSYTSSFVEVPASPRKPSAARMKHAPPPMPRERIPGGPKYPTYRAIPIKNPRRNPTVRHAV